MKMIVFRVSIYVLACLSLIFLAFTFRGAAGGFSSLGCCTYGFGLGLSVADLMPVVIANRRRNSTLG